LKFEIIIFYTE